MAEELLNCLKDPSQWKLETADLIQQLGLLVWLNKGDEHKDLYKMVTGARVCYELYNRLSTQRTIEAYQTQCILGIVNYIKSHPKASEKELQREVQKHIEVFKDQVGTL